MGFAATISGGRSARCGSCSGARVGRMTMGSTARRLRPRLSRVRLIRGVLVDETDGGDDIDTKVHNVSDKALSATDHSQQTAELEISVPRGPDVVVNNLGWLNRGWCEGVRSTRAGSCWRCSRNATAIICWGTRPQPASSSYVTRRVQGIVYVPIPIPISKKKKNRDNSGALRC